MTFHRKHRGRPRPQFESSDNDFLAPRRHDRAAQKAAQLCRQVERTLALALPACADPLVSELSVLAVHPAPDAGRLLLELAAPIGSTVPAVDRLARLTAAAPFLRHEIASAITRKRAPELSFVLVAPPTGGDR